MNRVIILLVKKIRGFPPLIFVLTRRASKHFTPLPSELLSASANEPLYKHLIQPGVIMKRLSVLILGSLVSMLSAHAVEVVSAKLDSSKENLIVTVRHGGGCGDHKYTLVMGSCLETFPVQCSATIKHATNDMCEAYLTREATFSLSKNGLKDKYYAGASLRISGDNNSSAALTLPKAGSQNVVTPVASKKVRCTTHTGSELTIGSDKVVLKTTDNKSAEYKIVKTDYRSIETFPAIDQMTLKLDDGRSLQTEFTSGQKTGTGQFIRLDGTYSPEFSCTK